MAGESAASDNQVHLCRNLLYGKTVLRDIDELPRMNDYRIGGVLRDEIRGRSAESAVTIKDERYFTSRHALRLQPISSVRFRLTGTEIKVLFTFVFNK